MKVAWRKECKQCKYRVTRTIHGEGAGDRGGHQYHYCANKGECEFSSRNMACPVCLKPMSHGTKNTNRRWCTNMKCKAYGKVTYK